MTTSFRKLSIWYWGYVWDAERFWCQTYITQDCQLSVYLKPRQFGFQFLWLWANFNWKMK